MQIPDTWPVRGRGIAFFILIGTLAFCSLGHAQQLGNGDPLDPNEESPSAQQIVVTASKRPETLTQAPMAVSVLTQEQLKRTGAEEIQNLVSLVPAFEVQTIGGANSIQLAIRGVTNSDFNAGNPAVATHKGRRLAVAIESWEGFDELKRQLEATGHFSASKDEKQRLHFFPAGTATGVASMSILCHSAESSDRNSRSPGRQTLIRTLACSDMPMSLRALSKLPWTTTFAFGLHHCQAGHF